MDTSVASTSRDEGPTSSSSLDKLSTRGDGMIFYPSGNIAVIVCLNPEGQLITFMSDNLSSQVLAHFDHRGVGSCNYPNGKPWLVVSNDGFTLSDKKGFIVDRSKFPRASSTPITLPLSDCLTVTFISRQDIVAEFRCEEVARTFKCGEQLRRTETYLNKVTAKNFGKLELDTDAIRQRQKDVGSLYVPKGPHHQATVQYGTGTLKNLLKTMEPESEIMKTINDLEESRQRVALVDTMPKHLYDTGRSKSAGTLAGTRPLASIPDFGNPRLSPVQQRYKHTMRKPDYSKSKYKGRRSLLRRLSFAQLQQDVLGPDAGQDQLIVVVVVADWAPLSGRAEAALAEAAWSFQNEAANNSSSPEAAIQAFKMDASESGELQKKYKFRFVPMFLMYYEGNLVFASNNLRTAAEVSAASLDALTRGRKRDFLPHDFTFGARDNEMLDYIKRDMSLLG